jgi:NTE family protein
VAASAPCLFPANPLRGVSAAAVQRRSLVSGGALRSLLTRHLQFERLPEPSIGLHVVVGDVRTGEQVLLSRGLAVGAILASTAIPGVLPPVQLDGRRYMDGGVVNNTVVAEFTEPVVVSSARRAARRSRGCSGRWRWWCR